MKEVSFTFGRFNPPTTGHALLIGKLSKLGGDKLVFTSHSNDKLKNPLPHKVKVKYLRKFFGKKVGVPDANVRTVFEICNALQNKGYEKVNMMVGSDRVREFDNLLNKYNGVKARHGFYDFKEINVISAGERDPDAEDVTGMSASKMRAYAEKDDFENFAKGVPTRSKSDAQKLFKDVKKGMGIVESTLPTYMIEDLIAEGVYDPGIFKAVFLAGGPGSGKSTVVQKLSLNILGLKTVNSDKAFEHGLKKAGMSLNLTKAKDEDYADIRDKAKRLTTKSMDLYIRGRLGMVFDTTSSKTSKIKQYKKMLDQIGYEYKMIYVNTSLDNALERNRNRPRKLRDDIVKMDWENAQKAVKEYKKIFGRNFIEVINDDDLKSLEKKATNLYSKLSAWASAFPGNKLATSWKERELLIKKGVPNSAL